MAGNVRWNLRQLQCFLAFAEDESVTRAASRLGIAQPALTRHLHAIERGLGVTLYVRVGRGIQLTPEGQHLRKRIQAAFQELDAARLEIAAMNGSRRRINLGLPLSLSTLLARPLVDCTHDIFPRLRVIDGWTGFIIEWLVLGRLDLGVISDHTLRNEPVVAEPLVSEEHYLVCSPEDAAALGTSIPLGRLVSLPLVLPSREHGLRLAVEEQLGLGPRGLTIEYEIDTIVGIKQFVEREKLYTVLPKSEMREELKGARLAAISLAPPLSRTLSLAWPERSLPDEVVGSLVLVIKDVIQSLIAAGELDMTYVGGEVGQPRLTRERPLPCGRPPLSGPG